MSSVRNRTLHSMALVCRDFYHQFFPLLFEDVYTTSSRLAMPEERRIHERCARFCRAIVEGDEHARGLATRIKRYAMVNVNVDKRFEMGPTMAEREQNLATFSKALAYMRNLQELYLFDISITNDILRSAACLPSLSVFQLDQCGVSEKLETELLEKFSALPVTRMQVEQSLPGDVFPYDHFTRYLCTSKTEQFISDRFVDEYIIRGLVSLSFPMHHLQILHLKEVYIDRQHPELISEILSATPVLKSLHIAEVHYRGGKWDLDDERAFQFVPCSSYPKLPNLIHVFAPVYAIQALVPGSNTASIGFSSEYLASSLGDKIRYANDEEFWRDCTYWLDKSESHIAKMEIPAAFYWGIRFSTHFPELRRLTIHTSHPNWSGDFFFPPEEMIGFFLGSKTTHPKLLELRFIYKATVSWNAAKVITLAEDVMALLKSMIPTLQSLTFSYQNLHQTVDLSSLQTST